MATQNQDRLRTHFAKLGSSKQAQGWDALWEEGTFIPWDRGYANPALIDLLASPSSPPQSAEKNPTPGAPSPNTSVSVQLPAPTQDGKRKKALVPGCGRGFDVVLLASYGYDAVGLEVSEHAAKAARQYIQNPGKGALEGEYNIKDEKIGQGEAKVVVGDYFKDEWLQDVGAQGGFDVIYDNTFLCALPPDLRPKWAARTAELLAPNGALICLEFPTHKPAKSQGPPWSLPPTVHAELLKRPGDDIQYDDEGVVIATDRSESDKALTRVAHYVPKRTHAIAVINGVVRDCVSVWRHKS